MKKAGLNHWLLIIPIGAALLLCLMVAAPSILFRKTDSDAVSIICNEKEFKRVDPEEDDQERALSERGYNKCDYEPKSGYLKCFDISENGFLVVESSFFVWKSVTVYDETGQFAFAYSFKDYGASYVFCIEETAVVFSIRKGTADGFDLKTGKLNQVWENVDPSGIGNGFVNRERCEKRYTLKHLLLPDDWGIPYSFLSVKDQNGEQVLVDHRGFVVLYEAIALLLVSIWLYCLWRSLRKEKLPHLRGNENTPPWRRLK